MPQPIGTITFLFTDIEGSTQMWERCPEAMRISLARHDELLREAIKRHNGFVFKMVGDAFCAAFHTAPQALNAALDAQLALLSEEWGETGPIRVRMGLHTGEAEERDNDYFGPTVNRVARLHSVGHGQQTLMSRTTYELVRECLPAGITLGDMNRHRLKDLLAPEHVWQLLHPSLPNEFPPLKSLDYLPTNLPALYSSFIGREREIVEIEERLQETRLLTLTGSGGTGKTRLSLQVAADVLDQYLDGVWFVELAPTSDSNLVSQTVRKALNIREVPDEADATTLLSALQDKCMLLVLDSCEHLVGSAAQLVDAVLKSCQKVKVLVSSREALGMIGETRYRVPSLTLPEVTKTYTLESISQCEAVRLFVERAQAVKSDFTVTNQNVTAVASVCQRLDGIPLAIELAAAWVRSLTVDQIDERLNDRFCLLTGGSRTAPPRHQTLLAAMDWSYNLLNQRQKVLLGRLSVFAGGWTLEAVENVSTGDGVNEVEVVNLLTDLVDKSLVIAEDRGEAIRYRLLETIRQFANDRLVENGDGDAVRKRHLDYFLAVAEDVEPKLTGPQQGVWLQRLENEHENLTAALYCSLQMHGSPKRFQLCWSLSRFWDRRGYLSEGREWCERALSILDSQVGTSERAKVLRVAGALAVEQGDYTSARAFFETSLTICQDVADVKGISHSRGFLGLVDYSQEKYGSALVNYNAALTTLREIGDLRGVHVTLHNMGNVALRQFDTKSARAYHEEALLIVRDSGDLGSIASSLNNLGIVAKGQGDYAAAKAFYTESLAIRREVGDRPGMATSLTNLGNVALDQGDYIAARSFHEDSLAIETEIGSRHGIGSSLLNLGNVAADLGDYDCARRNYQDSLAIKREIGDRNGIADLLNNLGTVATAQGDYSRARGYSEESLDMYREIGDTDGIASSLANLARLAANQGRFSVSRAYCRESLDINNNNGDSRRIASSLEAFASLAAKEKKSKWSSTLWGAVEVLRERIGFPRPPCDREQCDSDVAEIKQAIGEQAFSAAWEKGRSLTMEQAIELALDPTPE